MKRESTQKKVKTRTIPDGSITTPAGFRASGTTIGLKASGKPDLALIVSDIPASCAGVFTTNRVRAACVDINRQKVSGGVAQAIVINSGVANTYTGDQGYKDALMMCQITSAALGIDNNLVLGASTGVIGEYLPMQLIQNGIKKAVDALSFTGGLDAAKAIMTTDTVPKYSCIETELSIGKIRIGAIAKGSGMIDPNLATMLSFITTDALIEPNILQLCLSSAVEQSFNCVTVDSDTSTNDMVIVLANGASGVVVEDDDLNLFQAALNQITRDMARKIAADGEGATKLVEIEVLNAASPLDAKKIAKTIANSPLVKTAIFGKDPNWGRILAAAGRSGAEIDQYKLSLYISGQPVVVSGKIVDFSENIRRSLFEPYEVKICLDVALGHSSAKVWTCDLTYEYIKINAEYHT